MTKKNKIEFRIDDLFIFRINRMLTIDNNTKASSLENLPAGIIAFKSWWKNKKKFNIKKVKNILLKGLFFFRIKKKIRLSVNIHNRKKIINCKNIKKVFVLNLCIFWFRKIKKGFKNKNV